MLILYKNVRNVRFVLYTKTSIGGDHKVYTGLLYSDNVIGENKDSKKVDAMKQLCRD